jgi:hypothetical protein
MAFYVDDPWYSQPQSKVHSKTPWTEYRIATPLQNPHPRIQTNLQTTDEQKLSQTAGSIENKFPSI